MARPERIELPTYALGKHHSIQLSYEGTGSHFDNKVVSPR